MFVVDFKGVCLKRGIIKPSREEPPTFVVEDMEDFSYCIDHGTCRQPRKLKGKPLPVLDKDAKFIPSQCPKPVTDFSVVQPRIKFSLLKCDRPKSKPKAVNYGWCEINAPKNELIDKLKGYHSNKVEREAMKDQKREEEKKLEKIALTVKEVITQIEIYENKAQAQMVVEQAQVVQDPPRVRRTLEEGSYPNISAGDEMRLPPLLRYCWKGKVDKVESYLKNPQNRNKINFQVDSNKRSALHIAASWGDLDCVKILLTVPGISLNLQDNFGMTPLFKAAQIQSFDCVKSLVEAGSNPLVSCHDGRNVLEYTIMEQGDQALECIRYLYSLEDLHKVHAKLHGKFTNFTLLHRVCLSKAEVDQTLEMLIKPMLSDLDIPEGDGLTPLFVAVIQDRLSLVKILVKHGANVDIRDNKNKKAGDYTKSEQ